ncbi:ATPase, AAA-type, core [Syntrophomonas zehnderi OL-4]|uniref:ATPase, AAA-type, core n=1 Tax=Syntrophomonas zehnderi OL-4 TaxID=690567 RepID=A0A0E4G9H6_9FIRM|nr:ATP-binding protein [Syntrophomonas zehnderi]CFX15408.1 ATPase, AAA-type, core [Syntrophomonas zehnderi OL-4]
MYKSIQINDFRLFKNQKILLGKYLTILSGRNSTGKSTILGMIANSGELKKKDGVTYFSKAFRSDFSELFKGSKTFDVVGANRFLITLCDDDGNETDYRSFRTAWQQKDKDRKSRASSGDVSSSNGNDISDIKRERFRIIPFKKEENKRTEAKFNFPVIYLGLSRLFPLGESNDELITANAITFKNEEHKQWFITNYKMILSMQSDVQDITNYSIGETDKKSGIGISTDHYDYLTNSSGQDNLGQILLALLSFRKLKEERGMAWDGGILLIDEIDSTLHPAAQNRLIKLFIKEARSNKLQIILTTHSISLLRDICGRIAYNSHDENVNNDIELYYLTNANRRLEIKRNIAFTEIESDLLVSSVVQNTNKIKVYSEDAEARWFLKYLIPDYLCYVDLLESFIGCDSLISMYNADIYYFGNTLIVFDGDVSEEQLNKIPDATRQNLGNILRLPGGKPPEQVIYEYLLNLDSDHAFWSGTASSLGFTWDYFKERGPLSDDYKGKKDRDKYKAWFNNHRQYFEPTKLMDFWMQDNKEVTDAFKRDFLQAYNCIAKRTATFEIK